MHRKWCQKCFSRNNNRRIKWSMAWKGKAKHGRHSGQWLASGSGRERQRENRASTSEKSNARKAWNWKWHARDSQSLVLVGRQSYSPLAEPNVHCTALCGGCSASKMVGSIDSRFFFIWDKMLFPFNWRDSCCFCFYCCSCLLQPVF